jgi:hypothetical protein
VLPWLQIHLGKLNNMQPGQGLLDVLTGCLDADPAKRWAPGRVLGDLLLWEEATRLSRINNFYMVRRHSCQHCVRAAHGMNE